MKTNTPHRIKHTKVLELTADSSGVNCDWQIGSYTDSYSIQNVRVGSRGQMEFKVETREQLGREIRVWSRGYMEFKVYNWGIEIRVGSTGRKSLKY